MKKTIFIFSALFLSAAVFAQEKCATVFSQQESLKNNPALQSKNLLAKQKAEKWLKDNPGFTKNQRNGVITIPVVFHVVYKTTDSINQNIHDSLLLSQLDVLNTDYRRKNADTINTRAVFDSIAADAGIEFCLATIDPNGNPTNGITRTPTTTNHSQTPANNSIKFDSTGGKNAWPTDQYLNIWVCDMSFFGFPLVLGYAQFPGGDPATDGVVLQYQFVGRTNNPSYPTNNLGRTAVHEAGHWLGLHHIWGDTNNVCSAYNDYIFDTPDAMAQSQSNCVLTANTCDDSGNPFWGNIDPPNMVENYMDYSAETCWNTFSLGQADRMWAFLMTDRLSLFTSNGCGTSALNAFAVITDPGCPNSCDGQAEINPVAGTPPYLFLWNDPLAQTDSIATGLCAGNYTCRVIDADNDTVYINVNIAAPFQVSSAYDVTPATCSGCLDGIIETHTIGGTPPYSFSLNGGTPQSDSMFVYLDPGTYYVEVTDSCGTVSGDSVTVPMVNSMEELTILTGFSVYPNPAGDYIEIEFAENRYLKRVSIVNALGEEMQHNVIAAEKMVFDISVIPPGIYFVRVEYHFGSQVRKFVIQR